MVKRIGIVGDVHAEHRHLDMALEHLAQLNVDTILCTGDLADGSGDIDACVELLQDHNVQTVRGNHDRWVLQDKARHVANAHLLSELSDVVVDYLSSLPPQLNIDTDAGPLMLCHGVGTNDLQKVWPGTQRMPVERSRKLDDIIAAGDYPLMINGHVHYRTIIHFDAMTLLNAGTLRGDHHPGFSVLDLEQNTVCGFELQPNAHQVRCHSLHESSAKCRFKNTQHFDGAWQPVTLYA